MLARYQLISGVLSYLASSLWLYSWLLSAHEMALVEWCVTGCGPPCRLPSWCVLLA